MQDEPVGMLRLYLEPSSVFIHSFRVHPECRGRGYGRQILEGVIDQLLSEGREEMRSGGRSSEDADWRAAIDSGILDLIREGRESEARELLRSCL